METLNKHQLVEFIKQSIQLGILNEDEDPVEKTARMIADAFIELRDERDYLIRGVKHIRNSFIQADAFRTEVESELIVCQIYSKEHSTNARKAVQDAINWNVRTALDPRASPEIRAMHDKIEGLHGIIDFMLRN